MYGCLFLSEEAPGPSTSPSIPQFHHNASEFVLQTDASAVGLGAMLCRWMLAMQEYDFQIVYRKDSSNSNADALSRIDIPCAVTLALPHYNIRELQAAQHADNIISTLLQARSHSHTPPQGCEWHQHSLRHYKQLWSQLQIVNHIPDPTTDVVSVPILPTSFRHQALHRNHGIPSAGHQGTQRTLE